MGPAEELDEKPADRPVLSGAIFPGAPEAVVLA
jgi:hypothetical protein